MNQQKHPSQENAFNIAEKIVIKGLPTLRSSYLLRQDPNTQTAKNCCRYKKVSRGTPRYGDQERAFETKLPHAVRQLDRTGV